MPLNCIVMRNAEKTAIGGTSAGHVAMTTCSMGDVSNVAGIMGRRSERERRSARFIDSLFLARKV